MNFKAQYNKIKAVLLKSTIDMASYDLLFWSPSLSLQFQYKTMSSLFLIFKFFSVVSLKLTYLNYEVCKLLTPYIMEIKCL